MNSPIISAVCASESGVSEIVIDPWRTPPSRIKSRRNPSVLPSSLSRLFPSSHFFLSTVKFKAVPCFEVTLSSSIDHLSSRYPSYSSLYFHPPRSLHHHVLPQDHWSPHNTGYDSLCSSWSPPSQPQPSRHHTASHHAGSTPSPTPNTRPRTSPKSNPSLTKPTNRNRHQRKRHHNNKQPRPPSLPLVNRRSNKQAHGNPQQKRRPLPRSLAHKPQRRRHLHQAVPVQKPGQRPAVRVYAFRTKGLL